MKNTFITLLMFVIISFNGVSQKIEGISIMDAVVLKEGMEEKYIEVEEFWSKIHEELIKERACFGVGAGYERPMWYSKNNEKPEDHYSYGYQNWYPAAEQESISTRNNVSLFES